MSKRAIRIGRKQSEWRINAYECETDSSGVPVRKGRYVKNGGWYGLFGMDRLENEIMPKLAECAGGEWSYPFLITQHRLESKAEVHIISRKAFRFDHRKRISKPTWLAVILSRTGYKLLPSSTL